MTSKKTQSSTTQHGGPNTPKSTAVFTEKLSESLIEELSKIPRRPSSTQWPHNLPEDQQPIVMEVLRAKATGKIQAPCQAIVDALLKRGIDATINKVTAAVQAIKRSL